MSGFIRLGMVSRVSVEGLWLGNRVGDERWDVAVRGGDGMRDGMEGV